MAVLLEGGASFVEISELKTGSAPRWLRIHNDGGQVPATMRF